MPAAPIIVIEDDPFLRVMQIVLDPQTSAERVAAFADFFSHDEPDFAGYCARVRARATGLFPAEVRLVDSPDELRAALPDARAAVLESLAFGRTEIAAARNLKAVQKSASGCAPSTRRPARSAVLRCSPSAAAPTSPAPSTSSA